MVSRTSDWRDELGRWLKPFLDRLGHNARRRSRFVKASQSNGLVVDAHGPQSAHHRSAIDPDRGSGNAEPP